MDENYDYEHYSITDLIFQIKMKEDLIKKHDDYKKNNPKYDMDNMMLETMILKNRIEIREMKKVLSKRKKQIKK